MSSTFRAAVLLALPALVLVAGCATRTAMPEAQAARDECVVLLHGLWRSNLAMLPLEWHLTEQGYAVVNVDYPSTAKTIPLLAEEELQPAIAHCESLVSGPVHLVTHSLGGIVARYHLQDRDLPRRGRLVMLSPPNRGSHLITTFQDWPLFDWIVGPAGGELRQTPGSLWQSLGPLRVEVGVIAGKANSRWFPWPSLPEPHDGTVTLASTVLEEMRDFRAIDANHVSIRHSEEAFRLIVDFLQRGRFGPGAPLAHH